MGWCFAVSGVASGKSSSLSDLGIEFSEAKLTLQALTQENASLKHDLGTARHQVDSLTKSLVIANSEAEIFKRQATTMKLKMEALGIDAVSSDPSKLDQRLLKAVSDLRIVEDQKEKISNQLVRLMEAALEFEKSADTKNAKASMHLEAEMRASNQVLGVQNDDGAQAKPAAAGLNDATVISVKEDLALVVLNEGSDSGVKVGMPFQVWRKNQIIGVARVVDVRKQISGAVIQSLKSEQTKIKVGDVLKIDVQR